MLRRIYNSIVPPGEWRLTVVVLLGVIAGLGIYIFRIANAASYLSDRPETCMNCHVMTTQYASWQHSSHREVANCNDCHVPHNNVLNKYFFKAKDGMRHSTMFTLRLEPQVIRIKEAGRRVVHDNCIRCHTSLLEQHQMAAVNRSEYFANRTERECWSCHRETPHGTVSSLSSNRFARVPVLEDPVPEWLKSIMQQQSNQ